MPDRIEGRRCALALVTGALIAPAFVAGCSAPAKNEDGEGAVTANEDLMREHGVLRRILIVYREAAPRLIADSAAVDARALATAAEIFRTFGERYHEQQLEEAHIFPAVAKAGGRAARLVDTLKAQHERGRAITAYVIDRTRGGRVGVAQAEPLARAMLAFARMYEAHAAREDTVVFPAFKNSMSAAQYRELGERFEEIEHRQFGGDGFDMAEAKVASIEQALGISDLGGFTAPPPS